MLDSCQEADTSHLSFAIVGSGALGSVFAAALQRAGRNVVLLGRRATPDITVCEPPCRISQATLRVETDPAAVTNADVVLMLVKSYDTETATRSVATYLRPDATVVTLQNGLGNVALIRANLTGTQRVLAGVTSQAARRVSPGLILHTGVGPTMIGYTSADERSLADLLASVLRDAGLPSAATGDIDRFVWQKVAVNAAINGLTAIARVPNGVLFEQAPLREAAETLVEEAAAVASAYGYDLPSIQEVLRETIVATSVNRSSMLQDIDAGRPTEVDAIYGSLISAGQQMGLALPALTVIDALVRSIADRGLERENLT